MAGKQEIAKISSEVPAYLANVGNVRNEDNFDSSDIVVPRIKLLQGLSKECEQFEKAKAGLFWHTGFDTPLGEAIDFVVCSRKKKLLLVAPLEDGQGILARSEDCITWDRMGQWEVKIKGERKPVTWEITSLNVDESGLNKWGTYNPNDENSAPAATMFYEYLVLAPDYLEYGPAVISLARSQIKKAKKGLNDKIKLHESSGRPMQAICFRATSVTDRNTEGNEFKNWSFTGNGFVNEQLFKQAVELKDVLKEYKVQDEEEGAQEETTATGRKVERDDI